MDKLKMHSPDSMQSNIAKLAELFPNCMTESQADNGSLKRAIDFDLLRQELSESIVEGPQERYHLNWPGKQNVLVAANAPTTKTIRPCRSESVDFESTRNLFIEGDNLDVLKLLQETYLGKVKVIYIDPPYNTGSDFIYKDNFSISSTNYFLESGQVDDEGNRLVANTETNGRFHSDWLSMMYSRLRLARNLMCDDGMLFISIDDNELCSLKLLCDEVFGESNYLNTVSINAKVSAGASGGGEDKRLKKNIEYLLIYTRNSQAAQQLYPVYKETKLTDFIQKMKLEDKSFKYTTVLVHREGIEPFRTIKDGEGNDIVIEKVNEFRTKTINQISREEGISEEAAYVKYYNQIMTTTNAQTSIRTRVWEATENENTMYIARYVPKSGKNKGQETELIFMGRQKVLVIWLKDTTVIIDGVIFKREKIGTYWDGISWINVTKEGEIPFPNGKKPVAMIQRILNLCTSPDENALVLDFFAGSGSVAHSVALQNSIDGGNRRCISVQIEEPVCGRDKQELYSEAEFSSIRTVCDVAKERIKRAGKRLKEENQITRPNLDVGFRVLKLDTSNMKEVYYSPDALSQADLIDQIDNIKSDRSEEDLLFQVLLDWGVDLSLPIDQESVSGSSVFFVDGNTLAACFDKNVKEELIKAVAAKKPLRAVFRDTSFSSDSSRINVEQIFKQLSPSTELRCI
jgi:adenine-specific DNA-methyltransferase